MRCLICGDRLPQGVRSEAQYCSTNCRSKAYRIRHKAEQRRAPQTGAFPPETDVERREEMMQSPIAFPPVSSAASIPQPVFKASRIDMERQVLMQAPPDATGYRLLIEKRIPGTDKLGQPTLERTAKETKEFSLVPFELPQDSALEADHHYRILWARDSKRREVGASLSSASWLYYFDGIPDNRQPQDETLDRLLQTILILRKERQDLKTRVRKLKKTKASLKTKYRKAKGFHWKEFLGGVGATAGIGYLNGGISLADLAEQLIQNAGPLIQPLLALFAQVAQRVPHTPRRSTPTDSQPEVTQSSMKSPPEPHQSTPQESNSPATASSSMDTSNSGTVDTPHGADGQERGRRVRAKTPQTQNISSTQKNQDPLPKSFVAARHLKQTEAGTVARAIALAHWDITPRELIELGSAPVPAVRAELRRALGVLSAHSGPQKRHPSDALGAEWKQARTVLAGAHAMGGLLRCYRKQWPEFGLPLDCERHYEVVDDLWYGYLEAPQAAELREELARALHLTDQLSLCLEAMKPTQNQSLASEAFYTSVWEAHDALKKAVEGVGLVTTASEPPAGPDAQRLRNHLTEGAQLVPPVVSGVEDQAASRVAVTS